MRVSTEEIDTNHQEEEEGKRDFPSQYTKVKEGERKINEKEYLKRMGDEIETKEVDISIDDHPKLEKIGDYWLE